MSRLGLMTLGSALAIASAIAVPDSARADTEGTSGVAAAVDVRDDESDDYAVRHGSLFIEESKNVFQEYRWGGLQCPAVDLAAEDESRLMSLVGNKKLRVIPSYKLGAGSTRCLTRYTVVTKKAVDSLVP